MPQKKELKEIRTSLLSRGLSLAKASLKAGRLTATQMLTKGESGAGWLHQVEFLIHEIGQLKGTAMKVGQTLSMYGEHLLPPELNDLIKKLQQDSPPLAWAAIEKVLLDELGEDGLAALEVEHQSVASASIGQVHRARIRATGQAVALKVQYPGVDLAVETDLKLLKFALSMSDLVPRGPRMDQIFAEIRDMFYQEVDYLQERNFTEQFHAHLAGDSRYLVPATHPQFCTRRVFTGDFMAGVRADSPTVQALSLDRRNRLGIAFLELYLRELLDWRLVQTDPHLGNYLVQVDPVGEDDKLILIDFGAVRSVPEDFLTNYATLIEGGVRGDERAIERAGRQLKLLLPEDSLDLVREYIELSMMLLEPFNGVYDWGASDLPKRVAGKLAHVAFNYRMRSPPRELVFLDRKLGGVFIFLSVLKCKMEARPLLEAALLKYRQGLQT